jgi:L-malate glycosyltransferase
VKIFFCETFDDGTVGGSHRCMYNLIRRLPPSDMAATVGFLGHNLYVEKYRDIGVRVEVLSLPQPLSHWNVPYRKARNWYSQEILLRRQLEKYLAEAGYDLVVLNNSIFVSLPFVKACRRLRIPLVIYERGIGNYRPAHIAASSKVSASIPVSDAVLENMNRFGFRARIVERIYDGIELGGTARRRDPGAVKADLGIPGDSRVIGIIGNIRFWKGQEHFIEAIEHLLLQYKDLHGLVIGGWGEADRDYYETVTGKVLQSGLENRVHFLGYRTDVPDLLNILDVFVHASTKPEPFGMVILEAMAAGKPVVATKIGGPIEILDHGRCGILVPPNDGKAIADACAVYLDRPEIREDMKRRAYERVMKNFRLEQTVEQTVALFRKVCSA